MNLTQSDWIALIGVCVALAALRVAWLALKRKAISYEYSLTALLNRSAVAHELDLAVSSNGVPLHDPHLVEVTFLNHGNVPITPQDFIEPIEISFSSASSIAWVDVQSARVGFVVDYAVNGSKLTLKPFLMNPEDHLFIRAFVAHKPKFELNARIIGVSEITHQHPYNRAIYIAFYGSIACFVVAGLLWLAERLAYFEGASIGGMFLAAGAVLLSIATQSRLVSLSPVRRPSDTKA